MKSTEKNQLDDVNHLLALLEPEINDFQNLVQTMGLIDSPYKNEFNYMRMLVNKEKFHNNLEQKINLFIEELNQFGKIYDKIVEDDKACELYLKAGLLDTSIALQKRISNKLGWD